MRWIFNLLAVLIACFGSVALVYWILRNLLGLSHPGTLLLLIPATIVLAGAAVYGSYTGHQRFYNPTIAEQRIRSFNRRFRVVTLAVILVSPIILAAISLIVLHEPAAAVVFAAIAAVTTPWTIRRIRG